MARRREPGQPFLDHDVMSQAEQARWLGAKPERTKNLGHDSTVDKLTENPAGRMVDYANNDVSKGIVRGPPRSQGVYGRFKNPKDGTSTAENLSRWSDYSRANSYHRGHGEGVEPRMPDPRGGSNVPAADKGSDGYLAPSPNPSTKNWADYRAGSESGEGRLEKLHNKR